MRQKRSRPSSVSCARNGASGSTIAPAAAMSRAARSISRLTVGVGLSPQPASSMSPTLRPRQSIGLTRQSSASNGRLV